MLGALSAGEAALLAVFCAAAASTAAGCAAGPRYRALLAGLFARAGLGARAAALAREVPRKSFHLLGSACGLLLRRAPAAAARAAGAGLCVAAAAALALDALRLRVPALNGAVWRLCGGLMRPEERGRPTGVPGFLLGLGLSMRLFDARAAAYALDSLFLGDTAAALVGTAVGRRRLRGRKSLEGFLACLAVCAALARAAGGPAAAGLAPALAELLAGGPLDDNLLMPLAAGAALAAAG